MTDLLTKYELSPEIHNIFIKYIFARIETLLEMRFDLESYAIHERLPKNTKPIWIIAF